MQSRQSTSEFRSSALWIISIIGKDRPGLIRDILEEPATKSINIVDMDQKVMQGIFVMSVIADFSGASVTPEELKAWLNNSAPALGIEFNLSNGALQRNAQVQKEPLHCNKTSQR